MKKIKINIMLITFFFSLNITLFAESIFEDEYNVKVFRDEKNKLIMHKKININENTAPEIYIEDI